MGLATSTEYLVYLTGGGVLYIHEEIKMKSIKKIIYYWFVMIYLTKYQSVPLNISFAVLCFQYLPKLLVQAANHRFNVLLIVSKYFVRT